MGVEHSVELAVIVIQVDAQLMRVAPIQLSGGLQIEIREFVEGAQLVPMREVDEATPVLWRQANLARRYRPVGFDRAVAREHAAGEKLRILGRGGKLKVAVQVSVANAFFKRLGDVLEALQFDDALHFLSRHQPQAPW